MTTFLKLVLDCYLWFIILILGVNLYQGRAGNPPRKRISTLIIAALALVFEIVLVFVVDKNLPSWVALAGLLAVVGAGAILRKYVWPYRLHCAGCGRRLSFSDFLKSDENLCTVCLVHTHEKARHSMALAEDSNAEASNAGASNAGALNAGALNADVLNAGGPEAKNRYAKASNAGTEGRLQGDRKTRSGNSLPHGEEDSRVEERPCGNEGHRETDDLWKRWEPKSVCTICYILDGNGRVLLIERKKDGFGKGKVTAPGGHVEDDETADQCVIREVKEEVGLGISDFEHVGTLSFAIPDNDLKVHVYIARAFNGTPVETEEATPFWAPIRDLPFDRMFDDDRLWLPSALEAKRFEFSAECDRDGNMIGHHRIQYDAPIGDDQ